MPELPDVEGFRRVLCDHAVGARVEGVDVVDEGVLREVSGRAFRRAVTGATLTEPRRHGKWLVMPLGTRGRGEHRPDDPSVVFHFGMTGGLSWTPAERAGREPRHRHDRVVVRTPGGELRFRDMRKLQGIRLPTDDHAVDVLLSGLGPDAATVTAGEFRKQIRPLRRQLKPALMDQTVLAGLGNLLVDETLWRAGIRPDRPTAGLDDATVNRVHARMRTVVRHSIRHGRVPGHPSWLTGHRDRGQDQTCPRCGTPLRRGRVGGRTTVWCPHCQPG
ncbi:Fpg/Nei family DNA glycosylase [Actinopolymorpha singaporensis]|uniref:DNA-(Apurinic or apyrimidinic site) lyase /Formamidopyrimidine-DNA glycosylase n=1 Tax=Actinopolymorpha singaporensis TaxID=117157 RepID=A0A1H1TIA0_9ACTN|nr:DNA-formamidopyrimidine glycosylase family protein [Actinopolymorpha singaporensis]SDS59259.1 DNA-(apurinic or apyrimidinic site) lyase /Formamidopyrimidine-DNA glycosylase [Actinopolymorpha singaporensis]